MLLTNIHLIRGISQYDIFSHWTMELMGAFRRLGVDAKWVSLREDAESEAGEQTVSIGFNMIREWHPSLMHRKHLLWCVDHPAFCSDYFYTKHADQSFAPGTVPLLVDRSRCQFSEQIYRTPRTFFLPHGASVPFMQRNEAERPLQAVFFGTIESLPECRRRVVEAAQRAPGTIPLWEDILDSYDYHPAAPLDLLIWKVMRETLDLPDEKAICLFSLVYPWVEYYFRMKHRIAFFTAIKTSKVHIFGKGPWQELGLSESVTVHPAVNHQEVVKILRKSKVLLNHSPAHRDGSHERVFDGLACGCAVISTPSLYLKEQLESMGGAVFIDDVQWGQLDEIILSRIDGVEDAQEFVREKHTMPVRARQLLELIERAWNLEH